MTGPDRFSQCLAFSWRPENDGQPYHVTPGDHGGATSWAVTLGTFQAWRVAHKAALPYAADLRAAEKSELATILRTNFWNGVQADRLPAGVDLLVFDFGMCSGPATSVIRLQRVLNAMGAAHPKLVEDGGAGPLTLKAASQVNLETLTTCLAIEHMNFYGSLGQPKFVNGWLRRNADRLKIAQATCRQQFASNVNL